MAAVARLTHDLNQERASLLAKQAIELSESGKLEEATRKLREAAALGHDNAQVQAAFLKLHSNQDDSPLLGLCRRYALYHDSKAGDDAANYLKSHGPSLPGNVAVECLKIILHSNHSTLSSAQDVIISQLSRQSHDVRKYFASELQSSSTEFFDNIYERGDDAANCMRAIVLESSLWPSEEVRLQAEDDLFQLLLAKLMESGHDLDGRALKGLALLLMADVKRLTSFIDDEGFDAILSSLDARLPMNVRSEATVVVSKYLEVSEDEGQKFLTSFINTRVAKQSADSMMIALSAAAAIFPVAPRITAPILLQEGFLSSMITLFHQRMKNPEVYGVFLQLLSAACVDSACRDAISRFCSGWLSHMVSNGDGNQPAIAATVLAKLRTSKPEKVPTGKVVDDGQDIRELVDLFKQTLNADKGESEPESVEGLAYASLRSEVKEDLAGDSTFLKSLYRALDTNSERPEAVIGGLSTISNLTQYPPNLSEEQKKMMELRAYANATKVPSSSPLENEEHVTARCNAVVDAGVMPVLNQLSRNSSSSVKGLIDSILLSLSKNPKNRGKLAQQGAVKLLVSHLKSGDAQSEGIAAQALSRILISVDPSHIFPSGELPHITSAVSPLATLLKASSGEGFASDQPRDLLPVFESLLALTNLASSPDISAPNLIVRSSWDIIEDLLLSNNMMIRRATTELVCNLVAVETGAAKYLDGSKRSTQRFHILLALADVEDLPTRRAAGGALALLTEVPDVSLGKIFDIKRAPEIILSLCQDEDEEIVHRGLVCVRNLVCAPEPVGSRAREVLKENGAIDTLKACLKRINNPALLQIGVEALKPLVE